MTIYIISKYPPNLSDKADIYRSNRVNKTPNQCLTSNHLHYRRQHSCSPVDSNPSALQ